MPIVEIRIPQLGEGLQEARIVSLLKRPGDTVRRDEPIYEMETDKAVMPIESPIGGVLESWTAEEDQVLPIGAVVARMETTDGAPVQAQPAPEPAGGVASVMAEATPTAVRSDLRNANIPPRTRAYAKEKGLTEQEMLSISASSGKLMPADVDRYLATRNAAVAPADTDYTDIPMSARQRTLSYRLARTVQQVVPGTIEIPVVWDAIERAHLWFKANEPVEEKRPSQFLLMAWSVTRALAENSKFRSIIVQDSIIREYRHGNLGIAVALPNDELVSAVVPSADALDFPTFVSVARDRIARARGGEDQAAEGVIHVSLTNMASFGLRTAVPVVVPPSVATLFLGAPYNTFESDGKGGFMLQRVAHVVMTFDHRLINGVGAANFIKQIGARIERLDEEFGGR